MPTQNKTTTPHNSRGFEKKNTIYIFLFNWLVHMKHTSFLTTTCPSQKSALENDQNTILFFLYKKGAKALVYYIYP